MRMENFSLFHVIKFLLSQNSWNLLWERTMTQRKLKRPDEIIVWGQVKTIYIHMAVMEVHGDKSDIVHLALVLVPFNDFNMVFGIDCRTHWRSIYIILLQYNLLLTLSFGQEGYQVLSEHLNLPKNLHEDEETRKKKHEKGCCLQWFLGWELGTGCGTALTLSSNSVHREPFCLSSVAFTATLVASHLLC